ncbi:hypothetical protein CCH79_00012806 [Gambusia affinis]|uniref:LIM zinc-binding domain-containing protein n=1 Tax=Gambusia affinis TaxID=33528 RepID=A0A315V276_GAMAF|nr:hypothetical protein CCH79_00012806 [Gambusia affinis]
MVGYCPICGKPVYFGEKKRSLGRDYHPLCLKCQKCKRQLTAGQHAEATGEGCLHRTGVWSSTPKPDRSTTTREGISNLQPYCTCAKR